MAAIFIHWALEWRLSFKQFNTSAGVDVKCVNACVCGFNFTVRILHCRESLFRGRASAFIRRKYMVPPMSYLCVNQYNQILFFFPHSGVLSHTLSTFILTTDIE